MTIHCPQTSEFVPTLISALNAAFRKLRDTDNRELARTIHEGRGSGDERDDTVIEADLAIAKVVVQELQSSPCCRFGRIEVEESKRDGFDPVTMGDPANPFRAFVDPVDGSLCCKLRGPTMGMPFGTCITVVKSRPDGSMRFSDIQAAGLIDLRSA